MVEFVKVTFLVPNANLSGGCRIIAEHARMLHERGHEVTVVCGRRQQPGVVGRLKALAKGRPIRMTPDGPSHLDGVPFDVVRLERSRPIVARDVPDADLILSSWWETTEWMWQLPASKGRKINFLQGYEVLPWLPIERVQAAWRLPIPKIVVSKWLQDIAHDKYGDKDAILVPNGIDTEHFRYVDRVRSDQMVIGAMASGMGRRSFKRFGLAVETVKMLQSRGQDCIFIGFGSETDSEQLPSNSHFEVRPTQERIAEIYALCDCWLFTSEQEGYGLPLIEAMSCGTPVVATPAGAAPELLQSGGGRLVNSDDPSDLADAVEHLLNMDKEEWHSMSQAARAEAESHSWYVIGDRMEQALLSILERSPR